MNLVVQKAKHPELENYIHSAVNGLVPFLEKVHFTFIYIFAILQKVAKVGCRSKINK